MQYYLLLIDYFNYQYDTLLFFWWQRDGNSVTPLNYTASSNKILKVCALPYNAINAWYQVSVTYCYANSASWCSHTWIDRQCIHFQDKRQPGIINCIPVSASIVNNVNNKNVHHVKSYFSVLFKSQFCPNFIEMMTWHFVIEKWY